MKITTQLKAALITLALFAGINAVVSFTLPGSYAIQALASGLGCVVMVYLWILIIRKVERPLEILNQHAERVAGGDLREEIPVRGRDEIAQVSDNLNTMILGLNATVNTVLSSANRIVATIDALAQRAEQSEKGAKNQSAQSQRIAAAAEEMSRTIADISRNTVSAAETSTRALENAVTGKAASDQAVDAVKRVYDSTLALAAMVERLSASVNEISGIAVVIKGIADQTNLLALNAAIEAARAGEQGRGFAVVADEVRKLAERTIKATTEISEKIAAVRQESEQTSASMGQASAEVVRATDAITSVGQSLTEIVEGTRIAGNQITGISASVEEQSATAGEVATNIEKTAGIAREIEAFSSEVSHDVSRLVTVIEELRNSAMGFKTAGGEFMIVDVARTDHLLFVDKVLAHLKGDLRLDAAQLPDHHGCRFGKWYDGDGRQQCGHMAAFRALEAPHAKIHALAIDVVKASGNGNGRRGEELFLELKAVSASISKHLDELKKECER